MGLSAAERAEAFLNSEADDLYDIAQQYIDAIRSGKMGGRNIAAGQAKFFATEFRNRADALYTIAPLLRAHLADSSHADAPVAA